MSESNGSMGISNTRHDHPLSMAAIIDQIYDFTGGWPRRVGKVLFVHDSNHGIAWLDKPAALFGWLQSVAGRVTWKTAAGCVKHAELFAELQRTAQAYIAIEELPHEPPIEGHYYACGSVAPGDGHAFNELLNRFCPATDVDRDLIKSEFVTPGWGGPYGARPAGVVTSDSGQGTGKTSFTSVLGEAWGGVLSFSANEDPSRIVTRLLSPDALTKRVACLDNIKSHRFSWAELEALITTSTIGGHRMFHGEATRPNTLTWLLTLNGASLSTDMAQRSVIIKLRRPDRSASWLEETRQFIADHRRAIIADIVGFLRSERFPLDRFTRWASWERDVLQRLPEPAEAQKVILERQAAADVVEEEGGILEEYFAGELQRYGFSPETDQVFVASPIAAQWYNAANNAHEKVPTVSRIMGQLCDEERLKRLRRNRCNAWGRGFVWSGAEAGADDPVATDLADRIGRLGQIGHQNAERVRRF